MHTVPSTPKGHTRMWALRKGWRPECSAAWLGKAWPQGQNQESDRTQMILKVSGMIRMAFRKVTQLRLKGQLEKSSLEWSVPSSGAPV